MTNSVDATATATETEEVVQLNRNAGSVTATHTAILMMATVGVTRNEPAQTAQFSSEAHAISGTVKGTPFTTHYDLAVRPDP